MSTNYYFSCDDEDDIHIGKRSAAGWYCWDCGVSLMNHALDKWANKNLYGDQAVHFSSPENWLETCPICNQSMEIETLDESAAGRELGFNDSKPHRKIGVKTCSSFSWAISPLEFQRMFKNKDNVLKDEYEDSYSKEAFIKLLRECPIKYYDYIGTEFF